MKDFYYKPRCRRRSPIANGPSPRERELEHYMSRLQSHMDDLRTQNHNLTNETNALRATIGILTRPIQPTSTGAYAPLPELNEADLRTMTSDPFSPYNHYEPHFSMGI